MDPYEYLLNKFNVKLEVMPVFKTHSLYLNLETGKKLVFNYIPPDWTYEQIFKFYRNLDSTHLYRQYDEEIDRFCQQLRCFPDDLESITHVDLLLAVNGLYKRA